MKLKLFILPLLVLSLLGSCKNNDDSSTSNTTTTNTDTTTTTTTIVDTKGIFEELLQGQFIGNYHSSLGEISINDNSIIIDDKTYVKNGSIGSNYDTIVYLANKDNHDDILTFKIRKETINQVERINPYLVGLGDVEIKLMPSLLEIQGCYDANSFESDYKYDEYSAFFNISDDYDISQDLFIVGYGFKVFMSSGFNDVYYSKSYFVENNSKLELALSIYDYYDDYEYHSLTPSKNEDTGIIELKEIDGNIAFYSSLLVISGEMFNNEGEVSSAISSSNITIGETTYTYELGFDNNGQYISLNDGSIIRFNAYGFIITKDNVSTQYVYNTNISSVFEGNFYNETLSYTFTASYYSTILKLNDIEVSFEYIIKDNKKSIKTTQTNDLSSYIIVPEIEGYVLKSYVNNTYSYLVSDSYEDDFVDTFIHKELDNTMQKLQIDSSFRVLINNEEVATAYLLYLKEEKTVVLTYSINNVTYQLKSFDSSIDCYELSSLNETKYYFVFSYYLTIANKELTSNLTNSLQITDTNIIIDNNSLDYAITYYHDSDNFSNQLCFNYTYNLEKYTLILSSGTLYMYKTLDMETLIASYIKKEDALSLVGTYCFVGKYGVEKFYYETDGKFYADTINSSNDGLEKIQYSYNLFISSNEPAISFYYPAGNYSIYLYKDNYHLISFGNNYVLEEIFNLNGVYTDDTNSNLIYIFEDIIYWNSTKYTIYNILTTDNSTTLYFGNYYIKFEDTSISIAQKSDNTIVVSSLTKQDINLSSYVQKYTYTLDTTTYNFEFKQYTNNISEATKYVLEYNSINYDYIITLKDSKIALYFSIFGLNVYIYNDGTSNIIEVSSSIPNPPSI